MLLVALAASLVLGQNAVPSPGQATEPLFLAQDEEDPPGPASLVPS